MTERGGEGERRERGGGGEEREGEEREKESDTEWGRREDGREGEVQLLVVANSHVFVQRQ